MPHNHGLFQLSQRGWCRPRRSDLRPGLPEDRRYAKPKLEALEDRCLLSAAITDLGVLPGDSESFASAVNASGQVVGWSENSGSGSSNTNIAAQPFLFSNGRMTDLGNLPGQASTFAYGINASGQVVGTSGPGNAFLYSNGQMIGLGTLPGDTNSWANGLNDSGEVVGTSGSAHAFLYSNGRMIGLGTLPGDTGSAAAGINDSGQVVGDSDSYNGQVEVSQHAFLYSNGRMTDLGTLPGDTFSYAGGINGSGQVVGYSYSTGLSHAFLYSNGRMTNLGALLPLSGYASSSANGINDLGQVVGIYSYPQNVAGESHSHAFLYSNGQMIDLDTLLPTNSGWTLLYATAINDAGQIVGTGIINGQTHAFLLNLNPGSPPGTPPPSLPTPQPIAGGTVGGGVGTPTFFEAAIALYTDGVDKILQGDSSTLQQSIQTYLPYAVTFGIDFGELFVLIGELSAYNLL